MDHARARRAARVAAVVCLAVATAYLVAFKVGWTRPRAAVFAALVAVLAACCVAVAALAANALVRAGRRLSDAAELLAAVGVLATAAGGFANWAFGLQGVFLVQERQPVRLLARGDLVDFRPGPLLDRHEIDLVVALARLRLVPAGVDGFRAMSELKVLDRSGEEVGIVVERGRPARYRTLVFHQGAFGFAPRIVVERDGRRVFEEHVPFRTIREGPDGVSFLGEFDVPAEKLALQGAVRLDDLDDAMKGHPRLEIAAAREGRSLGAGLLAPGEFATLGDGYRLGFAGLQRWSEIDLARRGYPVPILGGAVAFAVGLLLSLLAAWRRW